MVAQHYSHAPPSLSSASESKVLSSSSKLPALGGKHATEEGAAPPSPSTGAM